MIIQSSKVDFASTHSYQEVSHTSYSVSYVSEYSGYDTFSNSLSNYLAKESNKVSAPKDVSEEKPISLKELRERLVGWLIDMLTHSKNRSSCHDAYNDKLYNDNVNKNNNLSLTQSSTPTLWKQESYKSYYREDEATTFSATGAVVTGDGRTIPLDVTFSMSRSFMMATETTNLSTYETITTDPLIVNLKGLPASLSNQHFMFDIDSDGTLDSISLPDSGSGFLALDKNGDGVINNGSELFGTIMGNGFAELSQYDTDKNGWIDEADDIYSKLCVWYKNEDGNDSKLSLKEAGIGAIKLSGINQNYKATDYNNQINGYLTESSIFLFENGKVGHIADYDLTHNAP